MEELPPPLRIICQSLEHSRTTAGDLDALTRAWRLALDGARAEIPGLQVEMDGGMVYWKGLSHGCQACKAGNWDCIFLTSRCNLACEFCYSPQALPADAVGSVFGATPEEVSTNYARTRITGVSFSGGEPFLEPRRLLDWVAWFREHHPDQYTWVYTNGLLLDEDILQRLGKLGLEEIRFNTAASNYDHPAVMQNLSLASRHIPTVTVEIPSIPAHARKLLACLQDWSDRGVKYLNLHELIYEPGTLSAAMAGSRQEILLPDGHRTAFNPESRLLTWEVMKKVAALDLPLAVNDCSMQSKFLQVRGRRRSLAPLVMEPHEKLVEDEILLSYCVYRNAEDYQFIHPDAAPTIPSRFPGYTVVRLEREAPLAMNAAPRWISCEDC